jgi:hypothetical protein
MKKTKVRKHIIHITDIHSDDEHKLQACKQRVRQGIMGGNAIFVSDKKQDLDELQNTIKAFYPIQAAGLLFGLLQPDGMIQLPGCLLDPTTQKVSIEGSSSISTALYFDGWIPAVPEIEYTCD